MKTEKELEEEIEEFSGASVNLENLKAQLKILQERK